MRICVNRPYRYITRTWTCIHSFWPGSSQNTYSTTNVRVWALESFRNTTSFRTNSTDAKSMCRYHYHLIRDLDWEAQRDKALSEIVIVRDKASPETQTKVNESLCFWGRQEVSIEILTASAKFRSLLGNSMLVVCSMWTNCPVTLAVVACIVQTSATVCPLSKRPKTLSVEVSPLHGTSEGVLGWKSVVISSPILFAGLSLWCIVGVPIGTRVNPEKWRRTQSNWRRFQRLIRTKASRQVCIDIRAAKLPVNLDVGTVFYGASYQDFISCCAAKRAGPFQCSIREILEKSSEMGTYDSKSNFDPTVMLISLDTRMLTIVIRIGIPVPPCNK